MNLFKHGNLLECNDVRFLLFHEHIFIAFLEQGKNSFKAVSYTHLDVYKRQLWKYLMCTTAYFL